VIVRDTRKSSATPTTALTGRDFRKAAVAVLAILVLLDLVVKHYRYFAIDGTFGFAAWFGALACFGLILIALAVGSLLRAPEGTYDD
jgi:uncharacterized membrane protein YhdT